MHDLKEIDFTLDYNNKVHCSFDIVKNHIITSSLTLDELAPLVFENFFDEADQINLLVFASKTVGEDSQSEQIEIFGEDVVNSPDFDEDEPWSVALE